MPLYEYQCEACGHRFEKIQKFSDAPETTCPKCGGTVHKLMSSPAFQFKGTGWYVTDYAKKGTETKAGTSEGSKTEGAKAETKTEAKTDTPKTETKTEGKTEAKSS